MLLRRVLPVVLLLGVVSCGTDPEPDASAAASAGRWSRVEGYPLSARTDPVVGWTGTEVVVVGGNTGWVCPPHADCPAPTTLATDGAAFDPATGRWRPIAPAPVGVWNSWGGDWDSAVVGGVLVVRGTADGTWQGYDVAGDSWSTLTPPAGFDGRLVASGGRLWATSGKRILAWDPMTDEVAVEASYAPDLPLQERHLFVTPAGPVVAGVRYRDAAPDEPTLTQVDVPDGAGGWRRWQTQQVGWLGHYDGTRLIGVEPGEVDGGEVNGWDRAYPFAGTIDPVSGDWQPLDVPQGDWATSAAWDVSAADGTRIVTHGQFLDTGAGRWTSLGRPESPLDHNISATWAGDRLFLLGGSDESSFEAPAGPEAWLWSPPT